MSFESVAVAMSLFGVKWLGTSAIFSRSQTFVAPLIFRNSVMATAADNSFAMTRSSVIEMMYPGAPSGFPEWAASIFAVIVIWRGMGILRTRDTGADGRQRRTWFGHV